MRARARKGLDISEDLREFLVAVVLFVTFMLLLAHGWTLQKEVEAKQLAHWQEKIVNGEGAR